MVPLLNCQYLGNCHDISFTFRHERSPLHTTQNESKNDTKAINIIKDMKDLNVCTWTSLITYR